MEASIMWLPPFILCVGSPHLANDHSLNQSRLTRFFSTFREHNDATMTALEDTMDLVEEEIRVAKIKFEEDILRIGDKMQNSNAVSGFVTIKFVKVARSLEPSAFLV